MKTEGKGTGILLGRAIKWTILGLIVLLQFRLVSLVILVLLAAFFIFWRRFRRKPFVYAAAILLLVTSFLPFDKPWAVFMSDRVEAIVREVRIL